MSAERIARDGAQKWRRCGSRFPRLPQRLHCVAGLLPDVRIALRGGSSLLRCLMVLLDVQQERQAVLNFNGQLRAVLDAGELREQFHLFLTQLKIRDGCFGPGTVFTAGKFYRPPCAKRSSQVRLASTHPQSDPPEVDRLALLNEPLLSLRQIPFVHDPIPHERVAAVTPATAIDECCAFVRRSNEFGYIPSIEETDTPLRWSMMIRWQKL